MAEHAGCEAAKTGFTLYGAFFQNVAREIGKERALALQCELGASFGRQTAGGTIGVRTLNAVQEARDISVAEYAALHEACPAVEASLEFRATPDGACATREMGNLLGATPSGSLLRQPQVGGGRGG